MFSPPKQSLLESQTLQRLDSSEVKNINLSQDDLNQTSLPPSPSKQTPYLLHKPYDNNAPPKRFLCFKRRNPNWKDMPNREIIPLLVDQTIPSNQIQTSKYTWLTFLPINLVEQFSQLANFYFLLITVMQTIPAISITSGNPVMAMPLTVILTISAIKALFEDWKRHKSDNEENGRDVLIYRKDAFKKAKWSDIRVGDVIQVNKNEPLPADIILLYSKDHKGKCYVETKNLDGETNLKIKMAHKDISKHFANNENINDTSSFCSFHYDNPTPYLYQFKGTATVGEAKISLDYNNFLLRGCTLKTTDYVYGLVTYTGHETKIMLNSVKAKPKHPRVEQLLSKMVILIFIAQLVVCLFSSLYNTILLNKDLPELGYLELTESKDSFIINVITRMGNWILIFTNFVPISMIVTLEIVRFIQSYQVAFDSKMITDDIWPVVQSSNLNEELGQIEYIFSDKTGTLTSNQMVFRTLSVNGNVYGDGGPRQDTDEPKKPVTDKDLANVDFEDSDFFKILENPSNREFKNIDRMLMAQAICHTVIVEHEGTTTSFSASSPDELALVSFAKLCKYEYKGTNEHNTMTIKTPQKEHKFHILHIFEFNSDRKRMSVVCKDEDGQVLLFCKGADSVIFDRLSNSTSEQTIQETNEDLTSFGNSGLRTLLYSMKKLNAKDYHQWMGRYHTAQTSMVDREKQVEALQDELERDLELLGATGIEDLLQDRVGETIEFVLDANIKLWVLTGDKVETALSIGKSCGLIRSDMKEFMIRANNEKDLEDLFTKSIETIKCTNEQFKFYIVITGETLLYMTNCSRSKELYEKFRILALEANTVLACRVSPKQKQEVVEIVRKANSKAVTLAIGDGANDVNMITAAQVGIGIRGKEGLQAARASDYSIGEFKHLKRLMFVHGREFYRKNTQVILYNFYKNMILVLPQFWYGFFNMFSGESLYDPVLYQFYNLLYASLPIGAFAIFDYQYVDQIFERYPKLYNLGRKNKLFTYMAFAKWVLFGAFQAIFVGLLSFYIIENVGMNEEGTTGGFWLSGCMTLAVVTISVNIKVILMCYSYHFLTVLSIIWSISIFYVTLVVLEQIESSNMFGIIAQCAGSVYYWTGILIVILLTNGIDVAIGRLTYLTDTKASQIIANLQNPGETSVISNSSYRRPSKYRKSTKKNTFLEFSL